MQRAVLVTALLVGGARAHTDDNDCDWWCSVGWIFLLLVVLGIIGCFFWGIAYYGGGYHVHRERFVQYDAHGKVVSYGYRTAFDGDVDGVLPPGTAASPYVGHAAHYGHSYAQNKPAAAAAAPYSKRSAAPPLRR